jgi:Squalene-hopene cyclase C-terminal domain
VITEAVAMLLATQNRDGGWPSSPGRASSTECTSLATLALSRLDAGERAAADRGVRWLTTCQNADGSWPLRRDIKTSSWTTSLATLTLGSIDREPSSAARGARWLLRQQPRTPGILASVLNRVAPHARVVKLDPELKGWAWTSGVTSFVEPTAYALLALKRLRSCLPGGEVGTRIDEAEHMLYDRMCRDGGWNYGNSVVLGAELWPYADVTALALLSLADHHDRADNERSLVALQRMLADVHSGLALSWAALCLTAHGQDPAPVLARLHRAWTRTQFLSDTRSIALAVLAASDGARAVAP